RWRPGGRAQSPDGRPRRGPRPPARQDRRADHGERAATGASRAGGGRPPFRVDEGEAVSQTVSASTGRRYGSQRAGQGLGVPRSTLYATRARAQQRPGRQKRGPKTAWTDAELTTHIRDVLTRSPFVGEGYRKVWARLRIAGIRTSKGRVLRLM